MTPDFELRGGVRRCAHSERVLRPADHYFSILREEKEQLLREDYAAEVWQGPPDEAFAWWESRPNGADKPRSMAPNDVLLKLFDQWADEPDQAQARFVLTLLLVRRRVMRIEGAKTITGTDANPSALRVYCPRRDATYDITEQMPDAERAAEIQQMLTSLLAA